MGHTFSVHLGTRFFLVITFVVANVFATAAWYGHLRFRDTPLLTAILFSWGIAFFEYCLVIPANRLGSRSLSIVELKSIQEITSVAVVLAFSVLYMDQSVSWLHLLGFALMGLGMFFIYRASFSA